MANSQKCIDINTASADELQTLPGIGRSRAEAIVKARNKMGHFESVSDLTKVAGISSTVLRKISSSLKCYKRQLHVPSHSRCVRHTDSSRVTRSLIAARTTKHRRGVTASTASPRSNCAPYWMRRPRAASADTNSSCTVVSTTTGVVEGVDRETVADSCGASASISHSYDGGVEVAASSPRAHKVQVNDSHCVSSRSSRFSTSSALTCVTSSDSRRPLCSQTSSRLLQSNCSDGNSSASWTSGENIYCRPHCSSGRECVSMTDSADNAGVLSGPADCHHCSCLRTSSASSHIDRPWMKLIDHRQCESDMPHSDTETMCYSRDPSKSPVYRKQRIPSRNNPPPMMSQWLTTFQSWSHVERLLALDELIALCDATQVRHVMQVIEPQFQRDFICLLPKELALYVLSYLEPRDLARASQTCHYWHVLAEDNLLWREKCREEGLSDTAVWGGRVTRRRPTNRISCTPSTLSVKTAWKNVYMRQKMIENNWSRSPLQPPKVLKGHDDHVITCLEFCGNKVVSGSDDNTLKVWSAVNGKCLRTLVGHTGGVWSSQMSGNTVISGSTDRTVKVWNADSGHCVFTLYGHTSTVRCMHLHEARLVSGSRDATLRVWDIESGHCLHVLIGHVAAVRCVQYDGRRVVSGAYDYMVKIWDPESETCLQTLSGHTNRVYSLQFDGVHIVSGSLDTSIRVWSAETGACLHTLIGHQSLTSGMELRDNILVSGNADSTVKVWNITTGQCLQTLQGANKHQSAVTCLQFNRRFVVTSSDDGTVKIWDLRTGEFLRNLVALDSGGSGGVVWRIRCSNSKLVCAVGSRNGTEETKLLVLDFDVDDSQIVTSQC